MRLVLTFIFTAPSATMAARDEVRENLKALQDLVWVPVVFGILEAGEGVRASAPVGVTLPGIAKRKAFRNSRGHGLATVVPWSVSAFLLGKTSVGRTKRGITSFRFVRAAESVRRPGLARSSGEVSAHPSPGLA